jgi:hypothetical protein
MVLGLGLSKIMNLFNCFAAMDVEISTISDMRRKRPQ